MYELFCICLALALSKHSSPFPFTFVTICDGASVFLLMAQNYVQQILNSNILFSLSLSLSQATHEPTIIRKGERAKISDLGNGDININQSKHMQ